MLGSFNRPADGSDRTLTPVPKVPIAGRQQSFERERSMQRFGIAPNAEPKAS